jgi:phage tail sheath protein FI
MPEYLSPGVYIEETSFRAKSIQGVATSTAGFVGVCRSGPVQGPPPLITSFEEFRRMFGGIEDLVLGGLPRTNYLAYAVKSFFDNGGQRVYVARIFKAGTGTGIAHSPVLLKTPGTGGEQTKALPGDAAPAGATEFTGVNPRFVSRFPGADGNLPVRISAVRGGNANVAGKLQGLKHGDVVEVTAAGAKPRVVDASGGGALVMANLYWVKVNDLGERQLFKVGAGTGVPFAFPTTAAVQRVTLTIEVGTPGQRVDVYSGVSTHPDSSSYIGTVLRSADPADRTARVYFALDALLDRDEFDNLAVRLVAWGATTTAEQTATLSGGNDGAEPTQTEYKGSGTDATATGLITLGEVEDIAIVAAPGSSAYGDDNAKQAVRNELITHCQNAKFRFAILSAADGLDEAGIRNVRSQHDTTYAAIYYPWITVLDPFSTTGETMSLPPDGSMAGIYARTDIERGVHKAPANEVVRDALRFSRKVTTGAQDTLNPEGINCLRSFEGRGNRVWGARTMSSDPEWTYINVRRLFIFLEHSIEKNTKWAVFEPNNESLWLKVRLTIESFLVDVFRTGALMGTKPQEAFFVRCDRSTMTQGDLDNGRLVVLIGVAPTKPAEFVIFRIGQWTADASIV